MIFQDLNKTILNSDLCNAWRKVDFDLLKRISEAREGIEQNPKWLEVKVAAGVERTIQPPVHKS